MPESSVWRLIFFLTDVLWYLSFGTDGIFNHLPKEYHFKIYVSCLEPKEVKREFLLSQRHLLTEKMISSYQLLVYKRMKPWGVCNCPDALRQARKRRVILRTNICHLFLRAKPNPKTCLLEHTTSGSYYHMLHHCTTPPNRETNSFSKSFLGKLACSQGFFIIICIIFGFKKTVRIVHVKDQRNLTWNEFMKKPCTSIINLALSLKGSITRKHGIH
jgi:hypothetical protein